MASRTLLALFAIGLLVLPTSRAQAAETPPLLGANDALQVLADLTLIDGACRHETVNFGIGFRFAAEKGVVDVAIMPGGSRHAEFEAVLRARRASFDGEELCGEIAANYAEALPGSVTIRPGAGSR